MNHSVFLRNALLDAMETFAGPSPVLEFRSGAKPANAAASRTGTVLATMLLPSDWLSDAVSGTKSKLGTWQDGAADAGGTLGYWTLYKADAVTVVTQGTVTVTGGGGEVTVDVITLVLGQPFVITSWVFTGGNA